jgi:hypothetical protein
LNVAIRLKVQNTLVTLGSDYVNTLAYLGWISLIGQLPLFELPH